MEATGRGLAGALRWDVFQDGRTTVDVTYERGKQDQLFGHLTLNDQAAAYVRGTGTIDPDANPALAGVQVNGVGRQRIAAAGNAHAFVDIGGTLYNLQSTATETYRASGVFTGANVATGADPQNPARVPLLSRTEAIVPRGQDFSTVGHLYRSCARGLAHLVETMGEDRLFIGPAFHQTDDSAFGWPSLLCR